MTSDCIECKEPIKGQRWFHEIPFPKGPGEEMERSPHFKNEWRKVKAKCRRYGPFCLSCYMKRYWS